MNKFCKHVKDMMSSDQFARILVVGISTLPGFFHITCLRQKRQNTVNEMPVIIFSVFEIR